MLVLSIPYQNSINKKIFDYISTYNQQQNNVNFADNASIDCVEANEDNHIYLIIAGSCVYLFIALSKKDNDNNYLSLVEVWAELKDVVIEGSNLLDNEKIYSFDIKKFYSTLSFSSNYKDRDKVTLESVNNNLSYSVSKTIKVKVATVVSNSMYNKIKLSLIKFKQKLTEPLVDVFSVTNVDKNSFLLPYFNHKDCLNFAVASNEENKALFCFKDNNYYIINNKINSKGNLEYQSTTLLRKDKFNCFNIIDNIVNISSGVWQVLVILQGNKQWKTLNVYKSHASLNFSDNCVIYHIFDKDAKYEYASTIVNNYFDLHDFELVGKVYANEIFLLNKLFPNSKSSYFDFSIQKFIGDSYVFKEKKEKEVQSIDLTTKYENNLPLCISFTELKHYIGGDLSQKDFILKVYTDGINVMFERWNNREDVMENRVIFNHNMSKQYLGI